MDNPMFWAALAASWMTTFGTIIASIINWSHAKRTITTVTTKAVSEEAGRIANVTNETVRLAVLEHQANCPHPATMLRAIESLGKGIREDINGLGGRIDRQTEEWAAHLRQHIEGKA